VKESATKARPPCRSSSGLNNSEFGLERKLKKIAILVLGDLVWKLRCLLTRSMRKNTSGI